MTQNQVVAGQRIAYLDGLRGIAILLVLLFHAYARWGELVPFGNSYSKFPLFRFGGIGVQLFFMISGFVILMTLEKCASFSQFVFRRWARLFPAMLVGSLLVFCTASLLPERPAGTPVILDLVPGLTFVDPVWLEALTGTKQGVLEGAFWSLFVEFKFYIIFGFLYFYFNRNVALISLAVIYTTGSRLMNFIVTSTDSDFLGIFYDAADLASGRHYAWFLVGALLYIFQVKPTKKMLLLIGLSAILAITSLKESRAVPAAIVLLLFISAVYSPSCQKALSNRLFLFLGFISYPLYLIHENAMIALIIKLNRWISIPSLLLPALPIAIIMAISWIIASYTEPWMRGRIRAISVRREALVPIENI
ncbi:MAG: acyltransferase family protein [Rhodomicrobium sp.]